MSSVNSAYAVYFYKMILRQIKATEYTRWTKKLIKNSKI